MRTPARVCECWRLHDRAPLRSVSSTLGLWSLVQVFPSQSVCVCVHGVRGMPTVHMPLCPWEHPNKAAFSIRAKRARCTSGGGGGGDRNVPTPRRREYSRTLCCAQAGIVCLSVVVAPAVVVYKSPQILVAAAKGTLRALAAGSEIGYEYALVPAANGVCPATRVCLRCLLPPLPRTAPKHWHTAACSYGPRVCWALRLGPQTGCHQVCVCVPVGLGLAAPVGLEGVTGVWENHMGCFDTLIGLG